MKHDVESLKSQYGVPAVLDHFGVPHARSRAACPLCDGTNPQAFAFGGPEAGRLWQCFSCHESGDAIGLYARLARVSPGRAIAEIASHLGLIESTPDEWDRRKRERDAALAVKREADLAESRRLTALAKRGYESERKAAWLLESAYRHKSADLLGYAYDAEFDAMVADYLAAGVPTLVELALGKGVEPVEAADGRAG